MFRQDITLPSLRVDHDRPLLSDKPLCDKVGPAASDVSMEKAKMYDPILLERILQSPIQQLVSADTRRFLDRSKALNEVETIRVGLMDSRCNSGKTSFCPENEKEVKKIHSYCETLGGTAGADRNIDVASKQFLDDMDQANLSGAIIWGLRPEEDHTHAYIHKSLHKALKSAFQYSITPRHLCYVPENGAFDLGQHFLGDPSRGRLSNSLVFASPKHMTWSKDPGFLMLPIDASARYVFHGETPRPQTALKRKGLAIEWEAWGPGTHQRNVL